MPENDPYKHWLIERAETYPLGGLYVDDLESRLLLMFTGAMQEVCKTEYRERFESHVRVLVAALETAEGIVAARRKEATTPQAA